MPARQSVTTRERILAVALELFGSQGYEGTSIRDIADRMAMTKAAVYYHFPSKEELLTHVLGPAMARVDRVLDEHPPARDAAERRALVADLVGAIAKVGPHVVVMLSDPAVGSHIQSLKDGSHLPEHIARALLPPPGEGAADPPAADVIRAACAVASLPAGIAAWRQASPGLAGLDEDTKDLLIEVVLAIIDVSAPGAHDQRRNQTPQ